MAGCWVRLRIEEEEKKIKKADTGRREGGGVGLVP